MTEEQIKQTKQRFQEDKIDYLDPSYDKAFKKIVFYSGQEISHSIVKAFLGCISPNTLLSFRKIQELSEAVDNKAASGIGQQNLLTDCAMEVDEIKLSNQPPNHHHHHNNNNAEVVDILKKRGKCKIDIEMQRKSQSSIGTRLVWYISKMFSEQQMVPSGSKQQIPLPVLGYVLCLWGTTFELFEEIGKIVADKESNSPSGQYILRINLGELGSTIKLDTEKRQERLKKLKTRFRQGIINYFSLQNQISPIKKNKSENLKTFSDLKESKKSNDLEKNVRTLYEWLCFFRCAHLMSKKQVKELFDENVKKAYKIMEIDKMDSDYLVEQVYDGWGRIAAEEQAQAAEARANKAEEELKNIKQYLQTQGIKIPDFNNSAEQVQPKEGKKLAEKQPQVAKSSTSKISPRKSSKVSKG